MRPKVKALTLFVLLALLVSACKFMNAVESLPAFQPTVTLTPLPLPTFTPAPTLTPTLMPTATLHRGLQNPQNGHWYLLVNQERSWLTSQAYCDGMGAHLVTIENDDDNQFVYSISPSTWLGASNDNAAGKWAWVTNEPMMYTNWASDEPNNCGEPDCQPEHYLTFANGSPQWSDVPAGKMSFICEWDK